MIVCTNDLNACDLTPLDIFLRAFFKLQVCSNKPQTKAFFKANDTYTIDQIEPDLCTRIMIFLTLQMCSTQESSELHLV